VEIHCPPAKGYVLVATSGSGSGSGSGPGTICVRGSASDQEPGAPGLPLVVRVTVVEGWIVPPPPRPEDGGTDTTPVGQDWCAHDVPVPNSSSAGVPCTAVAWCSAGTGWTQPTWVHFYAGGPDPVDCCDGCPPAAAAVTANSSAFRSWPPPPPPLPPDLGGPSESK
jgi:hypothetical protein